MPDFDRIMSTPAGLQAPRQSLGYMDLSPKDRLTDQRFLSDVRQFAKEAAGVDLGDDKEAVDWFYRNRNFRNLNTVGNLADVYDSYALDKNGRERMKRIEQTYNELPDFWQSGGRGFEIGRAHV